MKALRATIAATLLLAALAIPVSAKDKLTCTHIEVTREGVISVEFPQVQHQPKNKVYENGNGPILFSVWFDCTYTPYPWQV